MRSRIIAWKDRVTPDNFAVNSEEPEYYRRSAGCAHALDKHMQRACMMSMRDDVVLLTGLSGASRTLQERTRLATTRFALGVSPHA